MLNQLFMKINEAMRTLFSQCLIYSLLFAKNLQSKDQTPSPSSSKHLYYFVNYMPVIYFYVALPVRFVGRKQVKTFLTVLFIDH
jgi:hypothetical protein